MFRLQSTTIFREYQYLKKYTALLYSCIIILHKPLSIYYIRLYYYLFIFLYSCITKLYKSLRIDTTWRWLWTVAETYRSAFVIRLGAICWWRHVYVYPLHGGCKYSADRCISILNLSADINALVILCSVHARDVPWIVLMTIHEVPHSMSAVLFQ